MVCYTPAVTFASRRLLRPYLLIALIGLATGVLAALAVMTLTDLPQIERLEKYEPKSVTVVKDIHGKVIHEFFRERRIPLSLADIPPGVRLAFLAAEDWRFYDHFGLDLRGLLRAFLRNLREQKYVEGASTITQQLTKVLFLTPEKPLARKLKEAFLALRLEQKYSKEEILTLYLNQIYLGAGCYGVEAAAQTYFGKSTSELDIAESALLAALPKAPSLYSPFKNPEKARSRRDLVLKEMFTRNVISRSEWLAATEVEVPQEPAHPNRIQSYFTAHLLKLLPQAVEEEQIFRGYLTIHSTLDQNLQKAADQAVQNGVERYAKRHGIKKDEPERLPQVALLAVEPQSGEIRAMVGGRSFKESPFNRAIQALRQPGSSFKPILYAAAIEQGYTQSTLMEDEPISFSDPSWGSYEPKNYADEYDGTIPLRIALEKSKNVVAIRLLRAIGVPALQKMASRLGITSPIAHNLSSALGSSSLSVAELARAYATIAAGGLRPELRAIRSVTTRSRTNIWNPSPPSQSVLDPALAYLMTDMLSGVVRFGTGRFARDLPCALAGKTGTTNDNVDSLFAGFSPHLVAVVWVGFDDRTSLGRYETGAVTAGPIWKEFMRQACDPESEPFLPPPGVLLVDVDHSSGKLPGPYCTDIIAEAFLPGTQPQGICREEMPNL